MTALAPEPLRSVLRDGFRLIGRFVRAHKASFSLAVAGAAMFASTIIVAPIVIGRIAETLIIPVLDEGAPIGDRLTGAVAAVVGVALWRAAAIILRRTAAGWLQARTQADVRTELIEHEMRLELAWFSRQSTGDLMSVAENDARQATFILAPLPFGTGATLLLVDTISMVFILDWALGLVTLVGLGLVVTVDIFGSWRTFESFQEVQRLRGIVSGVAHESFDGALTVKSLGREGFETDRFRIASEHLRDNVIKVGRIWDTLRSVVESLPSVTIVALLVAGALRIRSGAIDAGELVTVAYLVSLASLPVRVLGYVLWELAGSIASWRRIETVLETREFVRHGDEQAALERGGAAVEGGDVAFSYDGVEPVLNDLQLDIPAGRTVAIVGPTGSGKSTLTLLLARLWDPATGRIELDGRDLRAFAHGALSREVAFVAQEAFLFDDDVRGNVTLGMRYDFEEVVEAARLAAADEFVRNLVDGYSTHLGERGTTLSGGSAPAHRACQGARPAAAVADPRRCNLCRRPVCRDGDSAGTQAGRVAGDRDDRRPPSIEHHPCRPCGVHGRRAGRRPWVP